MLKKMILMLALFAVPLAGHAATVQLPKTGQTTCYDATGAVIACTAPAAQGEDGQLQKGVTPPTPRFVDNNNGTVTDNLTGLTWLKDAGCTSIGPQQQWTAALTAVQNLASGQCGLTDGTAAGAWRLPNVLELESLVDLGNHHPALPAGNPFTNTQESFWTSTTHAHYPANAWVVNMVFGNVAGDEKNPTTQTLYFVWPVRGGQ